MSVRAPAWSHIKLDLGSGCDARSADHVGSNASPSWHTATFSRPKQFSPSGRTRSRWLPIRGGAGTAAVAEANHRARQLQFDRFYRL